MADDVNHLIRKFDPKTREVSTLLGHGKIKFKQPHGVAWEKGKLYVVDSSNQRILRVEYAILRCGHAGRLSLFVPTLPTGQP